MRISIGFVLVIAILSVGCNRIKPAPPKKTSLDSTLALPLSTINIPVSYEVDKLQEVVNKKLNGIFLDQWIKVNDKGDSLYLQLEKRKDIKLVWDGEAFSYSIPLNVSARFKKSIAGIKIRNNELIRTQLTLYLVSQIALDEEWNLNTKSSIKKINWLTDPRLKVAFLRINIRNTVENLITKNETMLLSRLDKILGGLIDTRKVVFKIWNDLQKPIRINRKGVQVWLKTEPRNISARFLNVTELLAIEVELKAHVRTMFDNDTSSVRNNVLPPFRMKSNDSTGFVIYVLSQVPFELTNRILDREITGKSIAAQGYSTTIKKLEVYGTDNGIAMKLKVRGDVDGQLYISAFPGYDTANSRLYADHFGFDIDTENALVNSADWILHDDALDSIKNSLVVDLRPYVSMLPMLIEQGIGRGRVGEKIDVTVDRMDLKPINHLITARDFQVLFAATGEASISLKPKVFASKKKSKKRIR